MFHLRKLPVPTVSYSLHPCQIIAHVFTHTTKTEQQKHINTNPSKRGCDASLLHHQPERWRRVTTSQPDNPADPRRSRAASGAARSGLIDPIRTGLQTVAPSAATKIPSLPPERWMRWGRDIRSSPSIPAVTGHQNLFSATW